MRVLALVMVGAFLAAPALAQDSAKAKEKKLKHQQNVITLEEIDAVRNEAPDAYSIIQRLRPQYFRIRGGLSVDPARAGEKGGPKVVAEANFGPNSGPYNILPLDDTQAIVSNRGTNTIAAANWVTAK